MVSVTDPNEVLLTGENSFIRLAPAEGQDETTRTSHWRILASPAGPGHTLFLTSELTDNEIGIYSDNIALARWLQEEIEPLLYPPFGDQDIPVIDAEFSKSGDGRSFWTETVDSLEGAITLTWYDFGEPFMVSAAPGDMPGIPLGVYSCLTPARRAQVTIDDRVASGAPVPEGMGNVESSTACLAWSETWVRPP